MARKQKEVEDALFQIKSLEESLQKNAQGILSSTMKEEIRSLVKESLKEQDEVEDEDVEDEMDTDVEMDLDTDNEDEMDYEEEDTLDVDDEDMTDDMSMDSDDDTIDMTGASDAEVLRVFRAMSDNDGVVVKRDDNMIHLSDNENDTEYIIQLSESMMDDSELKEFGKSEFDLYDFHHSGDKDEDEFDFSFEDDEDDDEDELYPGQNDVLAYEDRAMGRMLDNMGDEWDSSFEDEHDYDDEFWGGDLSEVEMQDDGTPMTAETTENIYELELDEDMMDFGVDKDDIAFLENDDLEKENRMYESKGFKAKGIGMGSASKYKMSKKPNMDGGFKTVKKNANKTMGTGKAKFEYKEEVNVDGFDKKPMKKMETKEAARTRGNGDRFRDGGLPKPRAHSKANINIKKGRMNEEVEQLREKNEEYRRALDLFRTKLNEVAVFNSNLAYATRLFTEHSTTKQEKINILKRFDNVETLKESKNLYRAIKDELGNEKVGGESTITESIQRSVSKTPETGSAVNLIESKTYENPQFLRMKDLMAKIK